jgi:hypothetical protein
MWAGFAAYLGALVVAPRRGRRLGWSAIVAQTSRRPSAGAAARKAR